MNEFITVLIPVIQFLIAVLGGCLVKIAIQLYPQIKAFIIAKVGLLTYQRAQLIASDIFGQVEEDGRLGNLVTGKAAAFGAAIRVKIPGITSTTVDTLRQSIANEYNKDKAAVIVAVKDPVQIVAPTITYHAPDGTVLAPIAPIEKATII